MPSLVPQRNTYFYKFKIAKNQRQQNGFMANIPTLRCSELGNRRFSRLHPLLVNCQEPCGNLLSALSIASRSFEPYLSAYKLSSRITLNVLQYLNLLFSTKSGRVQVLWVACSFSCPFHHPPNQPRSAEFKTWTRRTACYSRAGCVWCCCIDIGSHYTLTVRDSDQWSR